MVYSLIEDVININITREKVNIAVSGLDTLLLINPNRLVLKAGNPVAYVVYSNLAEVLVDHPLQPDPTSGDAIGQMAAYYFAQESKPARLVVANPLYQSEITGADSTSIYNRVVQAGVDFYGVIVSEKNQDVATFALAPLIAADKKLLFATLWSSNGNPTDDNDTTSTLYHAKDRGTKRFVYLHINDPAAVAAWVGMMFAKDVGSATWAFKSPAMVGYNETFSTNQIEKLNNYNANYTMKFGDRGVTFPGKTTDGEYIDVVHGLDWFENYLQLNVANAFISNDKIPFTTQGISIIEGILRTSLIEACNRNILDKTSIQVEVPDLLSISSSDRSNRILPNVKFSARLQGAIHKTRINGLISF